MRVGSIEGKMVRFSVVPATLLSAMASLGLQGLLHYLFLDRATGRAHTITFLSLCLVSYPHTLVTQLGQGGTLLVGKISKVLEGVQNGISSSIFYDYFAMIGPLTTRKYSGYT